MNPVPVTPFGERLDRFVQWFFDVSPNEGVDSQFTAERSRARGEKAEFQQPQPRVRPARER